MRTTLSVILITAALTAGALAGEPVDYFQGFETDTAGWFDYPSISQSTAAEADVPDNEGTGVALTEGTFTRFGGYTDTFPEYGYATSLDVYIDLSAAPTGNNKGWWWSVASSDSDGEHLADFIFNTGTYNGNFYVDMAGTSYGYWPPDPHGIYITHSGWYTLRHEFSLSAGQFQAAMSVIDKSNDSVIGTVVLDYTGTKTPGGNRYGWLSLVSGNGQSWPVPVAIDAAELTVGTPPCIEVTVTAKHGCADLSKNKVEVLIASDEVDLATVDPASLYLQGAFASKGKAKLKKDGLEVKFEIADMDLTGEESELILFGVAGEDVICGVVPVCSDPGN